MEIEQYRGELLLLGLRASEICGVVCVLEGLNYLEAGSS